MIQTAYMSIIEFMILESPHAICGGEPSCYTIYAFNSVPVLMDATARQCMKFIQNMSNSIYGALIVVHCSSVLDKVLDARENIDDTVFIGDISNDSVSFSQNTERIVTGDSLTVINTTTNRAVPIITGAKPFYDVLTILQRILSNEHTPTIKVTFETIPKDIPIINYLQHTTLYKDDALALANVIARCYSNPTSGQSVSLPWTDVTKLIHAINTDNE